MQRTLARGGRGAPAKTMLPLPSVRGTAVDPTPPLAIPEILPEWICRFYPPVNIAKKAGGMGHPAGKRPGVQRGSVTPGWG